MSVGPSTRALHFFTCKKGVTHLENGKGEGEMGHSLCWGGLHAHG